MVIALFGSVSRGKKIHISKERDIDHKKQLFSSYLISTHSQHHRCISQKMQRQSKLDLESRFDSNINQILCHQIISEIPHP